MKRVFQDTKTGEIVEVPEIRPGIVNFHGCVLSVSEIRLYDWEEMTQVTKRTHAPLNYQRTP
jgi:hypothetical protein